jgi:acyl-CoA thioesterase-1
MALLLLAGPGLAGPASAEELRVVALGDSLTHGYGLPPSQSFPAQLETWLAARGHEAVEIVNAGVSGDTTAGGRARLDWALAEGGDALIVELGGNDLLRGIDPAVSRENLDAILAEAAARGLPTLLTGLTAPPNYGPEWRAAFDAMFPELAEAHGALLYRDFLAGVVEDRSLWQADGIHPNAEGVAVIVERIGPSVERLIERARAKAPEES